MTKWLIYGANGYTGRLIAEEAKRRSLEPFLAGRNPSAMAALAQRLSLPHRIFSLDSTYDIAHNLEGMDLVVHCAGPFQHTAQAMAEGCLAARAHYLDISGEIDALEAVHGRSREFQERDLVAIPGSGFDIVPTDCVAKMLKERLPSANQLKLAYKASAYQLSGGTYKSVLEGLAQGCKVRKDGQITRVHRPRMEMLPIESEVLQSSVLIPWGDVSTAYYSTGIPNIEVYTAMGRLQVLGVKVTENLVRSKWARRVLQKAAGVMVRGPSQTFRDSGRNYVWGEVQNARGESADMRISTPEGYRFTINSVLDIANRILGGAKLSGAFTPSLAFGSNYVLGLPDVHILR
jgi:short subunit dehydrogenase-like uncharacterized protein